MNNILICLGLFGVVAGIGLIVLCPAVFGLLALFALIGFGLMLKGEGS